VAGAACTCIKDQLVTHTHTDREQHPDTHTHDKNSTHTPTNTSHKHLTTLEGGATTVRATSHARVRVKEK